MPAAGTRGNSPRSHVAEARLTFEDSCAYLPFINRGLASCLAAPYAARPTGQAAWQAKQESQTSFLGGAVSVGRTPGTAAGLGPGIHS